MRRPHQVACRPRPHLHHGNEAPPPSTDRLQIADVEEEVVAVLCPPQEADTSVEEEEACWTKMHSVERLSTHRELVASSSGRWSEAVEVWEAPSQAPEHSHLST